MEDLIKRDDAIKAVVNTPSNIADVMGNNLCLDGAVFRQNEIIDILKSIPSAEPTIEIDAHQLAKLLREGWTIHSEPKQGEWIYHKELILDNEYYPSRFECDQCHHFVVAGSDRNFCPNCGARME